MEASTFSGLTCVDHQSLQEPPYHSFLLQLSPQPKSQPSPLEREQISTDQFPNTMMLGQRPRPEPGMVLEVNVNLVGI